MIEYGKGVFGVRLLFQIHGSALTKTIIPSLLSVVLYFVFLHMYDKDNKTEQGYEGLPGLEHPYAVGVLMTGASFLIVFRANFGYERYWEACGSVHNMMSKWLDASVHTIVFHMQCSHFDEMKPPSFFDHPQLMKMQLTVDRQNLKAPSIKESVLKSINEIDSSILQQVIDYESESEEMDGSSIMQGGGRLDGGWGLLYSQRDYVKMNPSLFLQELIHLSSLCVAVAFCTLRNDVEGVVSPLCAFVPGSPWPNADLDKETGCKHRYLFWDILGVHDSQLERTKYNAERPMPVIGGVSDNEINRLQKARGSIAKTQLVWYWLSELITREGLEGSCGNVGTPMLSRMLQFLSDGMVHYNHARKIMYIPFPFPHAQISALSILIIVVFVPFLMDQYTSVTWVGVSLTFFTVLCLSGLHEVARELENPFRNVPNDIPLCTLLAMYSEALISVCSGYHPDHYFDTNNHFNNTLRPQSSSRTYQESQNEIHNGTKMNEKKQNQLTVTERDQYESKIRELEKLLAAAQRN